MKFTEDILKIFNLDEEIDRIPVNVMKMGDALQFLNSCAERIVLKSKLYAETKDADIQMDCLDIVTVKLNDFSQVFKDIIIFLRKYEKSYNGGSSLRFCINSYDTFNFCQSETEKLFLKEMLLRNEITHDYFNRELHQQKLIWIMGNCAEGACEIYCNLYEYCKKKNLLEKYIEGKIRS